MGEEGSVIGERDPNEGRGEHDLERRRLHGFRPVYGQVPDVDGAGQEAGRVGRQQRGLTMPAAATDWITLEEAAGILSAANIRFRAATIGGWARAGKVQSIKLGGRRFVRRGEIKALIAAPRRVRASDLQPGLFEDLRD